MIVRKVGREDRLFGTPWTGEGNVASSASGPLRALAFIRHGARNELRPIPPAGALKELLPAFSIFWFSPPALATSLDFCHELDESVPAFEIHCRPDPSAAGLIGELFRPGA